MLAKRNERVTEKNYDFPYIKYEANKSAKEWGQAHGESFREGIKLTFDWYNKNKNYYKSLSKKDIINRLGKG